MISITYIAVRFLGGGAPAGRVILELNCRHLAVYLRIINRYIVLLILFIRVSITIYNTIYLLHSITFEGTINANK